MFICRFQCACRWILRHQHKLRQQARSCSLKVKEQLIGNEDVREFDPEYSFRVSFKKMSAIVTKTKFALCGVNNKINLLNAPYCYRMFWYLFCCQGTNCICIYPHTIFLIAPEQIKQIQFAK